MPANSDEQKPYEKEGSGAVVILLREERVRVNGDTYVSWLVLWYKMKNFHRASKRHVLRELLNSSF